MRFLDAPTDWDPQHGARSLRAARTYAALLAVVIVPGVFALATVETTQGAVALEPQPSPLGYTVSLLFFVVPVAILTYWLRAHPERRAAVWRAWVPLFALGALLDFLFGAVFFEFPNTGATLGLMVPVVGGLVPVEEFLFYAFGFAAILLTYVWCGVVWTPAPRDALEGQARDHVRVHWPSIGIGIAFFAFALAWKKLGPHDQREGFPGYALFLTVAGVLPPALFFRSIVCRVNWHAVSFTTTMLLPVSLAWEGVLATPYGWWSYRPEAMMGLYVRALGDLPIEAVLLWLVVGIAGITIYEVLRALQAGAPPGGATPRSS